MSRSNREERDRSYGAPMGAPTPRSGGSPRVGPADPETRRRHLAAQAEEERRQKPPAPPAAEKPKPKPPTSDLSAAGAGRRVSGRQRQIDRAVEEALK